MILTGHVLEKIKEIPDESVSCMITSPPYWGLRDYKSEPILWGGDENCKHLFYSQEPRRQRTGNDIKNKSSIQANQPASAFDINGGELCAKCGAWKGELGLEPTYKLFIKHLIQIFDEVKRVLRKDGTCWVNFGDTYSMTSVRGGDKPFKDGIGNNRSFAKGIIPYKRPKTNIPSKSLSMIPQRFAIAMIDRGWILRNDIIWRKPNAMPSSAKDRFSVNYEHVFFFTKNKKYFFQLLRQRTNLIHRQKTQGS